VSQKTEIHVVPGAQHPRSSVYRQRDVKRLRSPISAQRATLSAFQRVGSTSILQTCAFEVLSFGLHAKTVKEHAVTKAAARHILVDTEEACADLKTEIENGADFAELARQHSNCPSSQRGGDLGEFSPGMMVPEFDKVVFSAVVGEVQGPVKTQFGYHLIEVTSRTD
jgi:peptidyl-prolyl cis-trans isomerase C